MPANNAFASNCPSGKAQSAELQLLSLLSQLTQLFKGLAQSSPEIATSSPDAPAQNAPAIGTVSAGNTEPVPQVNAAAPAETAKPAEEPKATEAALLDGSKYSSPKELERWAPLVANLPPDQQQAAKELNRPLVAARMAAGKGPGSAKTMDFINASPSLKTAIDTGKHRGKADGKITDGDLKAFAKNIQRADSADKDIGNYQKDHPDADPKHALGTDGKTKVDGLTSADGFKAIQKYNPGLASPLKQAGKTWPQPGFLTQIDQGGLSGRSLAAHSPGKLFDAKNISEWISRQAPANGGEFASMLSDAATLNSVGNVDISKLGKNVFDNPSAYSGEAKSRGHDKAAADLAERRRRPGPAPDRQDRQDRRRAEREDWPVASRS